MKHFQTILCASLLSTAVVNPALAQNGADFRTKSGPFMSLSMGIPAVSTKGLGTKEIGDGELSGTAGKVEAGYWFSEHWGASINHVQLGEVEQKYTEGTARIKGNSSGASLLGRLPFGESWTVIGKLNFTSTEFEDDGSTATKALIKKLTGKESSVSFPGLEVDYHINENAAIFLEVEGRGSVTDHLDVAYAGIGLRWNF